MTSARIGRSGLAAVVLAGVFATGLATHPEPAAAEPTQECGGIAGLDAAPLLSDDDGALASPLQDGTSIPVVMVHGWTGNSAHNAERTGAFSGLIDLSVDGNDTLDTSLIGAIQGIGGVDVYTFDYHDLSSRWVTDEGIGATLAESLTCLATAHEHPVVVVAHSMGGLATRQALGLIADGGGSPASVVSDVITYGTPNTGSDVARFLVDFQDGLGAMEGTPDAETATALHSLIVTCGAVASESLDDTGVCGTFGDVVASVGSDAVRGLATGSQELAALPAWPSGVNVHAYAGDATLTFGVNAWFFDVYESEPASLGDLSVPRSSALNGGEGTAVNTCPYEIDVNVLGPLWDKGFGTDDLAVLGAGSSGCFHGNLMRTVELTDSTTSIIAGVVQEVQGIIASGFPAELSGQWCSRLGSGAACFSVSGLREEFPEAFLSSAFESPATPGATRYAICLVNDLGDGCTMAATKVLEYYPAGVAWNCEEYAAAEGWPGCEPDFTDAHDVTEPRLSILPNHQHNTEFFDTEPLYRS